MVDSAADTQLAVRVRTQHHSEFPCVQAHAWSDPVEGWAHTRSVLPGSSDEAQKLAGDLDLDPAADVGLETAVAGVRLGSSIEDVGAVVAQEIVSTSTSSKDVIARSAMEVALAEVASPPADDQVVAVPSERLVGIFHNVVPAVRMGLGDTDDRVVLLLAQTRARERAGRCPLLAPSADGAEA